MGRTHKIAAPPNHVKQRVLLLANAIKAKWLERVRDVESRYAFRVALPDGKEVHVIACVSKRQTGAVGSLFCVIYEPVNEPDNPVEFLSFSIMGFGGSKTTRPVIYRPTIEEIASWVMLFPEDKAPMHYEDLIG